MSKDEKDFSTPQSGPVDTPADAAAAGANNPTPLDGNEAVNLAAEQSKLTAHHNIPPIGIQNLPVADDTANLRQGPSLHDALLGLLPLVGVWRGEGQAHRDGQQFNFGQQIIFAHDGGEYLTFSSRTWRLNENGEATGDDLRESGFWRISAKDEIEVTLTVSTGVTEILYGQPKGDRAWELESASTIATEQGPTSYGPGKRLYGLMPNHDLGWVDERVVDGKLVPHMSAQLKRIAG